MRILDYVRIADKPRPGRVVWTSVTGCGAARPGRRCDAAAYCEPVRTLVRCAVLALALAPAATAAGVDSPAATKRVVHAWSNRLNAYDNAGAHMPRIKASGHRGGGVDLPHRPSRHSAGGCGFGYGAVTD